MSDLTLPNRDRVEGYFKELNNWGRWGHDDQLGTVNLITPAKQAQAQRLVRKGRTVSLARDVIPRPVYMYRGPSRQARAVDVVLDRFDMVYPGWITHVDALCHVGWTAGSTTAGRGGPPSRARCGAPSIPSSSAVTPAVSSSTSLPEGGLRHGGPPLTPRELDGAQRRAGVEWSRGTWWWCAAATGSGSTTRTGSRAQTRRLHLSCLEWFRAKDIAGIAWDMMDDPHPVSRLRYSPPGHSVLGPHRQRIRAARPRCAEEGGNEGSCFTATPLRLVGATGSPAHTLVIF
jgi:hypothetical protein